MIQDHEMPSYHRSIEDNYERYFEESAGYAYDAFDRLSPAMLMEHDRCREATREELGALSPEPTRAIARWAMARAWLDCEQVDRFMTLTRGLLQGRREDKSGLLAYLEILELASMVALDAGEPQQVSELLVQWRAGEPEEGGAKGEDAAVNREHEALERLEALVELAQGNTAAAQRRYEGLIEARPDDAELAFELAKELTAREQLILAASWLDRAAKIAARTGTRAVLVDIALMRETHQQRQATDGSLEVTGVEEE